MTQHTLGLMGGVMEEFNPKSLHSPPNKGDKCLFKKKDEVRVLLN